MCVCVCVPFKKKIIIIERRESFLPDLLTRKSMMPLAGDERRLRDSGEREERRLLDVSVRSR